MPEGIRCQTSCSAFSRSTASRAAMRSANPPRVDELGINAIGLKHAKLRTDFLSEIVNAQLNRR